jgi:peptidoglycan/LPS O-acetylase OafA/YrhL
METRLTPTLEDRMIETRFRSSGFDYMRLFLATLVLLAHTFNVVLGEQGTNEIWRGPLRPFLALILPMFFSLSGFLVAGSFERCRSLISFFGLRILRIIPALAVEVVLSALILGPIFTTLDLHHYFTDPNFFAYFLNMVGDVHMQLPGVFADNVWKNTVNEQLWVLPRELKCYILLGFLAFAGVVKPNRQLVGFVIVLHIGSAIYFSMSSSAHPQDNPNTLVGWLLVLCFVVGVAMYVFRKRIPYRFGLFCTFGALSVFLLAVPNGDYFVTVPLTYATIYLGLRNPARSRLILSGDYSYGLYLYGFPIQQAIAALLPRAAPWYVNVALALPCTAILAVASWWLVEKQLLRLRPFLTRLEDHYLARRELARSWWVDWVRRSLSNE